MVKHGNELPVPPAPDGGLMTRLAIWATGHSIAVAKNASADDRQRLVQLGGAVWSSAAWTALVWAFALPASVGFHAGAGWVVATIVFAIVGGTIVLLFDRPTIYAMDTRPGGRTPLGLLALRMVLVVAIGSFTADRLVAFTLKDDLEYQSLRAREASDTRREATLEARFQTPQLAHQAEAGAAEVRRLEQEAAKTPHSILDDIAEAQSCSTNLNRERQRLLAGGVGRRETQRRLAGRTSYCLRLDRAAQEALTEFRENMRTRISDARGQATEAAARHHAATTEVAQRVGEGRAIERQSLTRHSSEVFWQFVASSTIAAIKVALIYIIMLLMELLPYAARGFAGQTALGAQLAATRAAALRDAKTQDHCHANEAKIAAASSDTVQKAMVAAFDSPAMESFLDQFCVEQAQALAPFDTALRVLRAAEAKGREFDSIASRSPELAAMAHDLFSKALQEAVARLRAAMT